MNIHRLLQNVKYTGNPGNFDTDFVTDDSRKVRAGCVFVRSKGGSFDGHTFAQKAVEMLIEKANENGGKDNRKRRMFLVKPNEDKRQRAFGYRV